MPAHDELELRGSGEIWKTRGPTLAFSPSRQGRTNSRVAMAASRKCGFGTLPRPSSSRITASQTSAGAFTTKLKCSGTWAVIDFKTQKMKPDKKGIYQANYYETWPLQLMAYLQALNHMGECSRKLEDICSVVINSVEPTPIQVKVWPRADHAAYWQAFQSARELWCFTKGYRPQPLTETAQAA